MGIIIGLICIAAVVILAWTFIRGSDTQRAFLPSSSASTSCLDRLYEACGSATPGMARVQCGAKFSAQNQDCSGKVSGSEINKFANG